MCAALQITGNPVKLEVSKGVLRRTPCAAAASHNNDTDTSNVGEIIGNIILDLITNQRVRGKADRVGTDHTVLRGFSIHHKITHKTMFETNITPAGNGDQARAWVTTYIKST